MKAPLVNTPFRHTARRAPMAAGPARPERRPVRPPDEDVRGIFVAF
jgi:hypothetical protein